MEKKKIKGKDHSGTGRKEKENNITESNITEWKGMMKKIT